MKQSHKNFSGPLTNAPAAPFFKTTYIATAKSIRHGEYIMPRLTQLQREQNHERVNRAAEIIEGYRNRVTGEDAATCLRDVLADLMHFSRANRLNFEDELASARNYFDEELNGLV